MTELRADVGFALDGDGDRIMLVDHLGRVVDGDQILFILARHWQERGELRGGVVGTQMANLGLENPALNRYSQDEIMNTSLRSLRAVGLHDFTLLKTC